MGKICIVTDNTALFPQKNFHGKQFVKTFQLDMNINGNIYNSGDIKVSNLPPVASETLNPHVLAPTADQLRRFFLKVSRSYDEVIAIFLSSKLNECHSNAVEAIGSLGEKTRILLIDSQTTSVGLGYLVQKAAEEISKGASSTDLERLLCNLISRIYSIFCVSGLTYLHYNKYLDHGQAYLGEMLGLMPTFALEDGNLTPLEKMRNHRHIIDSYQEFLGEFEKLEHVAVLQSVPPISQLSRLLREHTRSHYPGISYTEHRINLPLATLFGPCSTSITAIESINHQAG
jgi:DegV family protein with EDD domain